VEGMQYLSAHGFGKSAMPRRAGHATVSRAAGAHDHGPFAAAHVPDPALQRIGARGRDGVVGTFRFGVCGRGGLGGFAARTQA
jgi:hypothetical protein